MKLGTLIRNRRFWKIVGAVALGLLIWFVGPLVAIAGFRPLAAFWVRALLAPLPLALVLLFWWLERRRDARRDAALVGGLAASPVRAEALEMERKLNAALTLLRTLQRGKGRTYLYQLPWYVIIGPSGAGKTTALLNSGLKFPAAVEGEYRTMRGMPNTPNCEWWFTDSGVLIDTAGRFVTQENGVEDAAGWSNFLKLLKQHRPLQPLNGILVALPEPDLADRALVEQHLVDIRARLEEIGTELGQKLPIYILITKADLLFGFREFFARSPENESEQVLGVTAPDPDCAPSEAKRSILEGFDALVESLSARVADRVQGEHHFASRLPLPIFPQTVAALRAPLRWILDGIVDSTQFDGPRRVRGVFLTSGTQSGDPIDRLLTIAGMPIAGSDHAIGEGRSFFLRRLFSDLVFAEAGLAGENRAAEQRQRRIYAGSVAAAAALFLLVTTIWCWGYFKNSALIASTYTTAKQYAAHRGDSPAEKIARFNLLGDAVVRFEKADDFGLGLGQGPRLAGEVRGIYHRDLYQRLAPMLATLAEQRMQADQGDTAALYNDLKSYLILGGQSPRKDEQASHVATWAQDAWETPADARAVRRHTAEMLNAVFQPVRIDDQARDEARKVLERKPATERVYVRLASIGSANGRWIAAQHIDSDPGAVFARTGVFSIDDNGVSLFLTPDGYRNQFLPVLAQRGAGVLADERWVMGGSSVNLSGQFDAISGKLQQEYFQDFVDSWQKYLNGIALRPVSTLRENADRLSAAGNMLSPLAALMREVALATDFGPQQNKGGATALVRAVSPRAANVAGTVTRFSSPGDARTGAATRFQPLRNFVGAGGGAALEALLGQLSRLAEALNAVDAAGTPDRVAAAKEAAVKQISDLQNQVQNATIPPPFDRLIGQFADDALKAMNASAASSFSAAVAESFGSRCSQGLVTKFPFAQAAEEVPLSDFQQYFSAANGVYARFAQGLQGSIDKGAPTWRPAPAASGLGLSQQDVAAMQAADTITHAFFSTNPNQAGFTYQLEPIALTGADRATVTISGRVAQLDRSMGGAMPSATFDWPSSPGASITFDRAGRGPVTRNWPGVWAAFRMMRAASVRGPELSPSAEGRLEIDGSALSFRIRTFNVANPFANGLMARVRCPAAGAAAV